MTAPIRLAVVVGVALSVLAGWGIAGHVGAAVGLAMALALLVVPWYRQPLWSWAGLYIRRNRPLRLAELTTAVNDRSGGGVRYQDDVAVVAIQILGRDYAPTLLTGSMTTQTRNTLDLAELAPLMYQSLGLRIESISVISSGARRRDTGDYPAVYDTLIGTPPYAGFRETWLLIRLLGLSNADALRFRSSIGTAALATAQRIAAELRSQGIRTRVATATDMSELERRLDRPALQRRNQHWHSIRADSGWLTTYAYAPQDITAEALAQVWAMRVDGVTQNITLFPDGTASATVTVRTARPPTAPPSARLLRLPGQQSDAVASCLCGPRHHLRGIKRGPLPASLALPIGSSGVLLGKVGGGDRLLLPLSKPGELSRIHIATDDAIAKRVIIRAVAAGDRVTVHTRDVQRWNSVRMANVAINDGPRPVTGTTVSVVDGTVSPAPRPNTVIFVGLGDETQRAASDVEIRQTGPATVAVGAAGRTFDVEVELFRAENRYVASEPGA